MRRRRGQARSASRNRQPVEDADCDEQLPAIKAADALDTVCQVVVAFIRPWWEVLLLVLSGVLVGGVILLITWIWIDDHVLTPRRNRRWVDPEAAAREDQQRMLAFPY